MQKSTSSPPLRQEGCERPAFHTGVHVCEFEFQVSVAAAREAGVLDSTGFTQSSRSLCQTLGLRLVSPLCSARDRTLSFHTRLSGGRSRTKGWGFVPSWPHGG